MAIPEGQLSLVPEAFPAGARAHGRRTLEASVRMSFESFTRHCRGTVTSITFTFSFFLLLSLTNFPYQALTMMSPEDRLRQGRGERRPAPPPCGWTPGMVCSSETPAPTLSQDPKRGHAFSPILDSSASIILRTDSCISRTCKDQGRPRSGSHWAPLS